MSKQVTVRQAGGSVSITIPKEIAERVGLQAGDSAIISGDAEEIKIRPYNPDFARIWKLYEEGVRKYQNALRELAK